MVHEVVRRPPIGETRTSRGMSTVTRRSQVVGGCSVGVLGLYLADNRVRPDSVQSSSTRRRRGCPCSCAISVPQGTFGSPRRARSRRVLSTVDGQAAGSSAFCPAAMAGSQATRWVTTTCSSAAARPRRRRGLVGGPAGCAPG